MRLMLRGKVYEWVPTVCVVECDEHRSDRGALLTIMYYVACLAGQPGY